MTLRVLREPNAAAAILAAGGLVGLPTETVYGLAADARNKTAIARVFAVKGRPVDHPLIVHIADRAAVADWAAEVPAAAEELMAMQWPGPLTVVLRKRTEVSDLITGGQSTVAVRMPDSAAALHMITELGRLTGTRGAVVAPSANRFGAVSPTSAAHVVAGLESFTGPDDAVLDAGACRVGVESTIVDATGADLRVLRPGAVQVPGGLNGEKAGGVEALSPRVPGSLASHYSPKARVLICSAEDIQTSAESRFDVPGQEPMDRFGLIAPADVTTPVGWLRLAAPHDDTEYARMLYAALRAADEAGVDTVIAVLPAEGPMLTAITDRVQRAATK